MATNLRASVQSATINASISSNATLNAGVSKPDVILQMNYNKLFNKPKLNGETLEGDKSFEDFGEFSTSNLWLDQMIDQQYRDVFGGE